MPTSTGMRMPRLTVRRAVVAALVGGVALAVAPASPARAQVVAGTIPGPTLAWERQFPGVTFRESSPVAANLGVPAVAVGGLDGRLYAFDLARGNDVAGWPVATGSPIDASPAAVDTAGLGSDQLFVGSGSADGGQCSGGGVWSFGAQGNVRWHQTGSDSVCPNGREPFQSSPAIGDIT